MRSLRLHSLLRAALVALLLGADSAHAHFIWTRIEPGSSPTLRLTFAEEPSETTSAVPLERLAAAKAKDAAGREITLTSGSSFLVGVLGKDVDLIGASQTWGVVDRGGTFSLEYYAKAAATPHAATRSVQLPYEVFAAVTSGRLVVTVRAKGAPTKGAAVKLHPASGAAVDGVTDQRGEATFDLTGAGMYGVRARIVESRSGTEGGKAYSEVRHYSTLVFPVPAATADVAAKPAASPDAYALLERAHNSRQVLPVDYPGFRSRLVFRDDERSYEGTLVYRRKGETTVEIPGLDAESLSWVKDQAQNLTGHRRGGDFAKGDGRYPLELGPEDGNRSGRLIILNDSMKSAYRVKDNRVLEVTRTQDDMRFTISVIETMDADAGKYLANHFVVSYRDVASGALRKVDGYRDNYAHIDDVWLPTSRIILTVEAGSLTPRVRSLRLRDHLKVDGLPTEEPRSTGATIDGLVPSPTQPTRSDASLSVTENVTVVATGRPELVRETAVPVTVVDEDSVVRELMADVRDMVKWAPGVYVENNATRFGLNGINIRGIGGNRVHTQIDGVRTAEQFDFGPFGLPQYALDVEALKSVEIVRSAGSALYGSDALGGVVSFTTRDPKDYLAVFGKSLYVGAKAGYDGRRREFGESLALAIGGEKVQASVFVSRRDGKEVANRGTVETLGATRTAPNPQDRSATDLLAKLVITPAPEHQIKLAFERLAATTRTDVLTSHAVSVSGTTQTTVSGVKGVDDQNRTRFSLDYEWAPQGSFLDRATLRLSAQQDETQQDTAEHRVSVSPTRTTDIQRAGIVTFEQRGVGGELRLLKSFRTGSVAHEITLGGSLVVDRFDQLRDRVDINVATGAVVPSFPIVYPTKYFPRSDVTTIGTYLQDDISIGRVRVTPGVRLDHFQLQADTTDPVYLAGNAGIAPPVDLTDHAISPKLGVVVTVSKPLAVYGQYARGFRAPSFAYVNNGFTNLASGYTTLPNGNLQPELSDNFEFGLRGTFGSGDFSLGVFSNDYDRFIEITAVGVNPTTGLLEYQPRNVTDVRIQGVELAGNATLVGPFSGRLSFALIDGDNRATGAPLNSIPPARLVAGLRWGPERPFGAELVGTFVTRKGDVDTSVTNQYRPPGHALFDLTAFYEISSSLSIQAGVFNLLDRKYWSWSDVQGISTASPVLDRYTAPGRSASVTARLRM